MTSVDRAYTALVNAVLQYGQASSGNVRAHYVDGEPAHVKYLPNSMSIVFTPEMGVPIITSKRVAVKSMLAELDWIWRKMSNNVEELRQAGCTIWDEWEKEDGTIGPAYGAQLAKSVRTVPDCNYTLNQVEFVLHELKYNSKSRRIMTSLYDVDDLDEMGLEPCVFMTNWQVDENNKLHLNVVQRSADLALGVPFNWAQYGILHRRIAQCTGHELGNMTWTIFNAHVYLRHEELLKEQVDSYESDEVIDVQLPESLDFFEVPLTECKLINYKPSSVKYQYEVAI